jgi:hypothetical protein
VVGLRNLAHNPEVYADAQVTTVGSVVRARQGRTTLYLLRGGHGARIVLEPTERAAREVGRRVSVSGIFTVTFKLGYEILISHIQPVGSL